MNKPTKLQQLFEGHRRKASLVAWTHLRTKAGESRIKMDLRLPLLNESTIGMNDVMGEAYNLMAKEESKINRTSLNVEMEGMTLELYSVEMTRERSALCTGVKFQKFALVSAGEGEKKTLDLSMVAYLPASIQLRDWAWDNLHATFWLESVYSQSELDWVGEEEAPDTDPDTPEDDEGADVCETCGYLPEDCGCIPDEDESEEDSEDEEDPIEDVEDDEVAIKRHTKNLLAM
jgi:hypothetical protein